MNKKTNKPSSIMAKYLWSILAICGLAIVLYGIILFVAMPAAGTAVAMTGLICLNIGIKKNQKNEKVLKGKLDSNEKSLRSKAFKISSMLINPKTKKFHNCSLLSVG